MDELNECKRAIAAIRDLINDSEGVAGLHRNGDIAPWDELLAGGRFEEWLLDFSIAEELLTHNQK